jgi:hypothetical protein
VDVFREVDEREAIEVRKAAVAALKGRFGETVPHIALDNAVAPYETKRRRAAGKGGDDDN